MKTKFNSTFDYKLIYVFRINDENHKGLVKIGDATLHTDTTTFNFLPNCKELNQAAKNRINSYTSTAGIVYELLHTELAVKETDGKIKAFRDKAVHNVLIRSGIKRHLFKTESQGQEWFETDLSTAIKAIQAVKSGLSSLNPNDISKDDSPIIFRPEQKEAIQKTLNQFKSSNRMLWNAKMRFGKTLSALEVAKQAQYKKILIFTHRPVVSDGWFEDFGKIFKGTNYKFGSKTQGEDIEILVKGNCPFVYFASIQDLRGSSLVGGKFDKNEYVFLIDWDYIIVDEAHEGTQTNLGQKVLEAVLTNNPNKVPKLLELSGTPFNLLDNFKQNEIYTWDYIMEQRAKANWAIDHFGDSNPYEELPQLEIYTYDLDKLIPGFIDIEDSAFNFREFFRTWTGDIKKDYKPLPSGVMVGDFVHKDAVNSFLNLMCKKDEYTNFPYSTEENRSYYRHTLWMIPGVKEAKALSSLMRKHPVFGNPQFFKIVNVAGEGDDENFEEQNYKDSLQAVRNAIGDNPDDHYTITLSCGRLTTGVNIPEWTAVFMLAGSFSTSAANYLQTIFRVQTPANINGRMKTRCSVFDFAPDRTLKMVAEAGHLSSRTGNVSNDRVLMGEFLNFCPVISIAGANMTPYNVDGLLQQLKKSYTDRVVKSGFEDTHIYNDNLLKLDDIDLKQFEELKKIIGATKQTKATNDIVINETGLTDEQYEELERIEKKKKSELTEEQKALLEERKKKRDNAQKAMDILRGISIRIPLMIYGADIPLDKDITPTDFVDLIDDSSWAEFMPNGVTKETYKQFAKYYEQDVFVAAGRQIRNMSLSADELAPTERIKKISEIFSIFKNPDKETVLTPWRVVNMHLSDTLGGYNFFDSEYTEILDEPIFVDKGKVTQDLFKNSNVKILEINSKTGLYPLYVVYSIFRHKIENLSKYDLEHKPIDDIWREVVEDNLYVICKTPMAKAITKRTLLGYKKGKINAHAFDDFSNQVKEKPLQFKEKILRGSFWNKKVIDMKFDAIVGNPPYQLTKNGNNEQIHFNFLETAYNISSRYVTLIQPLNWLNNNKLLNLLVKNVVVLYRYSDSRNIFTTVQIPSGVGYSLVDKTQIVEETHIFDSNTDYYGKITGNLNADDVRILKEVKFSVSVFDRISKYVGHSNENKNLQLNPDGEIKIWYKKESGKAGKSDWYSVDRSSIPEGKIIDEWKVMISNDGHAEATDTKPQNIFNNSALALPPKYITTNRPVLLEVANQQEAELLARYANTKFFRRLLHVEAKSNSIAKSSYRLVPDISEFIDKYDGKEDLDAFLNKYFNLSEATILDINKRILPKQTTKLEF